jgi:DNA repair protein RecN (Recombination protein N)
MLVHLSVRNIATLAQVDLDIPPGLVVLTGETGAGKSLLVEALRFALGNRVKGSVIREGSTQAEVIAVFQLPEGHPIQAFLEEAELHDPDSPCQLVLRRLLKVEGRSLFQVNGVTVPTKSMDPVRSLLVDLTSQHAHVRLLDPQHHREVIDRFPSVRTALEKYQTRFREWSHLDMEAQRLRNLARTRAERLDYLRFVVAECDRISPEEQEETSIEARWKRLENAKEIRTQCATIHAILASEEGGLEAQTRTASSAMVRLDRLDPDGARSLGQLLDNVQVQLRELAQDLRNYGESVAVDEGARRSMEERVEELRGLRRRFGCSPKELIDRIEQARQELEDLDQSDIRCQEAEDRTEEARAGLMEAGTTLRTAREDNLPGLLERLHSALFDLEMPNAQITLDVRPLEVPGPFGLDQIRLHAQTNPGEGFHPLEDIASGGELSRLLLAIKATDKYSDPVLSSVFDEVDAGVSGQAAKSMAQLLSKLAEGSQVLCISHLPQIAAVAQVHLHATKEIRDGRTFSSVIPLEGEDRVDVITRLLSGDASQTARAHARELLLMTN